MIDEHRIESLLAAFYDGKTTPTDENVLRTFFLTENIPERWHVDRALFQALYCLSPIQLPEECTQRIEQALDKHIQTTTSDTRLLRKLFARKQIVYISGLAASILALAGVFFVLEQPHSFTNKQQTCCTIQNVDEAAVVATECLTLIFSNINKGMLPLEKMNESIDKTNKILNEQLKINK